MNITLGQKAKDKITGFEGILTAKCEHLYGCDQYCLMPTVDKDGKAQDGKWFDDGRIEIIGAGVSAKEVQSEKPGADWDNMPEAR